MNWWQKRKNKANFLSVEDVIKDLQADSKNLKVNETIVVLLAEIVALKKELKKITGK